MTPKMFDRVAKIANIFPFAGWGSGGGGVVSRCGLLLHTKDDADRIAAVSAAMFGAVVKVAQEIPGGVWLASSEWVA